MANKIFEKPWEGALEPARIFGNLYFVGTEPACTHIIKTKEGLIMLDSGYHESLYIVIDNMYRIGLDPRDIKLILHTHGHVDHFGATAALLKMTNAKAGVPEKDKTYVTDEENLSWADELELAHRPFIPDFTYSDGDVITLGSTKVKCVANPGHTPGTTTFVFDVTDGERKLTACLLGGVGTNSMARSFLDKYSLSYETRNKFIASMDRLAQIDCDIFLGNHTWNNDTVNKLEALKSGKTDAFIIPDENKQFAEKMKAKYQEMLKEETR